MNGKWRHDIVRICRWKLLGGEMQFYNIGRNNIFIILTTNIFLLNFSMLSVNELAQTLQKRQLSTKTDVVKSFYFYYI